MSSFKIYLLPEAYWDSNSPVPEGHSVLKQLTGESVALRRRIDKGANLAAEQQRYSTCLAGLESQLFKSVPVSNTFTIEDLENKTQKLSGSDQIHCVLIPQEDMYFELLVLSQMLRSAEASKLDDGIKSSRVVIGFNGSPGLGASVFPPNTLEAHLEELESFSNNEAIEKNPKLREAVKKRQRFVNAVLKMNLGLVEIIDCLDNPTKGEKSQHVLEITRLQTHDFKESSTSRLDFEELSEKGKKKMIERLTAEINGALTSKDRINMSNQPHDVSTIVLGRFLYSTPEQPAGEIRIVYADGSEAKPFPLRSLEPPTEENLKRFENAPVLSTALMSMRHIELDPIVDWAWYRNKEVSQTRSLSESDDFCFHYSQRQIRELWEAYGGKPVMIKMYHTGFEPAVIGLYRAVVLELQKRRDWLQVTPCFYRGNSFEEDKTIWR